jgi:hypothetical protein
MSLRAGLQTWYRVAALLVAAAIVLAAPYGVAVAMRSGIASIILRKAETAISGAAVDTSAPAPATGREAARRDGGKRMSAGAGSATGRLAHWTAPVSGHPRSAAILIANIKTESAAYCAASLAIACSLAAVSSLREVGCGMAMML